MDFESTEIFDELGIPGLDLVNPKEWQRRYVRCTVVKSDMLKFVRNFYRRNDVNGNCREMVMDVVKYTQGLSVAWGSGAVKREVSPAFKEMLKKVIVSLLDSMMKYGFAPWNVVLAPDGDGVEQLVPNVVEPRDGFPVVCTKKNHTSEMRFVSKLVRTKDTNSKVEFPVYCFPNRSPDEHGKLESPVSRIIYRTAIFEYLQNLDAAAATVSAIPPIVQQHTADVLLKSEVLQSLNTNFGAQPPAVGIQLPAQQAGALPSGAPLPGNTLATASANERGLADKEDELAEVRTERGGAGLTWGGSRQFIPDLLNDTMPPYRHAGPYFCNKLTIPSGLSVVHQVMPVRDAKLLDRQKELERSICSMWRIPSAFQNVQQTAWKDDLSELMKNFSKGMQRVLRDVCAALENILNAMYANIDTRELQAAYWSGILGELTSTDADLFSAVDEDERGPVGKGDDDDDEDEEEEEKKEKKKKPVRGKARRIEKLKAIKTEIQANRRYFVQFEAQTEATLSELMLLRQLGLTDEEFKKQLLEKFNLRPGAIGKIPSPEEMAEMTAPKKGSGKAERKGGAGPRRDEKRKPGKRSEAEPPSKKKKEGQKT